MSAESSRNPATVDVHQRWIARGEDAAAGDLGAVTALTVTEPTPKYQLLNRLLASEDVESYDFVVSIDDDVVIPDAFLDLFLGVQTMAGVCARAARSHAQLVRRSPDRPPATQGCSHDRRCSSRSAPS